MGGMYLRVYLYVIYIAFVFFLLSACGSNDFSVAPESNPSSTSSIYEINVTDAQGEEVNLAQYIDKVLLIVNVASKCGYTSQYEDLQALYEKYNGQGLEILAFPTDDFNQELDTIDEVVEFCTVNFGVTFPIFDLVHVKGKNQHELYEWLTKGSDDIQWNFEKFLINRNGEVVAHFPSSVNPQSQSLIEKLEELL